MMFTELWAFIFFKFVSVPPYMAASGRAKEGSFIAALEAEVM